MNKKLFLEKQLVLIADVLNPLKGKVFRPRGTGEVINGEITNYTLITVDIISEDNDSFKDLI